MENYTRMEILGEGSYGEVFKAMHKLRGIMYAIKQVGAHHPSAGIPYSTLREVSAMKNLDSNHIVKLRELIIGEDIDGNTQYFLVQELLDKDLNMFMLTRVGIRRSMNFEMAKRFIYQILLGVYECHRKGILHRDLKPKNILVQENTGTLKICDFGLARSFSQPVRKYTHRAGTLSYMPPEVLLKANLATPAIDMWAVGCIYFHMLTGTTLFTGSEDISIACCIFEVLGSPKHLNFPVIEKLGGWKAFPHHNGVPRSFWFEKCTTDQNAVDILLRMLALDYEKRITAADALRSSFFDDIRPDYARGLQDIDPAIQK